MPATYNLSIYRGSYVEDQVFTFSGFPDAILTVAMEARPFRGSTTEPPILSLDSATGGFTISTPTSFIWNAFQWTGPPGEFVYDIRLTTDNQNTPVIYPITGRITVTQNVTPPPAP